jgi:hypothetical protein
LPKKTKPAGFGRTVDSNNWPANLNDNNLIGEHKLRKFVTRFQMSEIEVFRAFREYVRNMNEMPKEQTRIRRILHTIIISFSERENEFLEINLIVTSLDPTKNTET